MKDFLLFLSTQMWLFKETHSLVTKLRQDSDLSSGRRLCLHFNSPLSPTTHPITACKTEQHGKCGETMEGIVCKLAPPCGNLLWQAYLLTLTTPEWVFVICVCLCVFQISNLIYLISNILWIINSMRCDASPLYSDTGEIQSILVPDFSCTIECNTHVLHAISL